MSTGRGSPALRVPMDVEYQPAWLTWVASTTTCLRALGVECDQADVAGFSGYAFHVGVHEAVCPSGPTVLDWAHLARGAQHLGRATVEFRSPGAAQSSPTRVEAQRAAFELVRREIEAGRPCVLWGTYVPEFGVVVGIDDESSPLRSRGAGPDHRRREDRGGRRASHRGPERRVSSHGLTQGHQEDPATRATAGVRVRRGRGPRGGEPWPARATRQAR